MWSITWAYIRDRKNSILAYLGGSVLLVWLYISIFPSILEQADTFNAMIEKYPPELLKAFNVEDMRLDNLASYLSAEHFSFVWPLLLIILVLSMSAGAIASEIEQGTIEMVLAEPVSRLKLYFSRYLAVLIAVGVFTKGSILLIAPLASAYDIPYDTKNLVLLTTASLLFGFAILGTSFLFSALFSEKGKVYFAGAGLLVAMYALNIVSSLKDSLGSLKYSSFFYYYNPGKAFVHGNLPWETVWVFLGIGIVATVIGATIFARRDIAT